MITLKRLNVVRKVATEEQAAKLERLGFTRMGGTAEVPAGAGVSEDDLERMFETLSKRLDDRLKAAAKGKGSKDSKKEGQNGGTDQPGGGDGAE